MRERLLQIIKHPVSIPAVIGALSFGGGVGVGYILGKRTKVELHEVPEQLELDFKKSDLEEMKTVIDEADYASTLVIDENVDELEARLQEEIEAHQGSDVREEVHRVVFAASKDEWDYEEEVAKRTDDEPYIIHKDEFYSDEMGFTQSTLCYYAGDDIMVDEDDSPIFAYERVTGPLRFGHGSGDPKVVYIRNVERKAEYEILEHLGLYSSEVLGIIIEENERVKDLKHSSVRKLRPE